MKRLLSLLLSSLAAVTAEAGQADTVRVSEFGAVPYSYENAVGALQQAIRACHERRARVLLFDEGCYDFWPEGAERREYFISNTSSEEECPSKMKTIGLLFEGAENLAVAGDGATLVFHGRMTPLAFVDCRRVRLCGLCVDFERPAASEMVCTKSLEKCTEMTMHRDTRYEVECGRIHLFGEGWRSNRNHCVEYNPSMQRFSHTEAWRVLAASAATEVAPGVIRFATPAGFRLREGNTLTVRDIIRDQVGIFVDGCEDVLFEGLGMHYMHGLGIVCQRTRNVTMRGVRCEPRSGSGRLLASSADFMHFSGCCGRISIHDCRFVGSQDDPVNIHGTNLRVTERIDSVSVRLRFMHAQSYGFNAFSAGDTVAFVRPETMERYASACVGSVRLRSDREIELVFDRMLPAELRPGSDCAENMSRTPEVEIGGCYFTRISTRGVLVTTPRRVLIEGNIFYKTGMSAILIEGDASGWYESGPVRDVTIRNNVFIDCAYNGAPDGAVIALNPSNTQIDSFRSVHRNVRIERNLFGTFGNTVLYAKSTWNLRFEVNRLETMDSVLDAAVVLNGCCNVAVKNNTLPDDYRAKGVELLNMERTQMQSDL